MIVRKLMYGYGALVWYHESEDLEVIQKGFTGWSLEVGKEHNKGERTFLHGDVSD